jgi:hypothetical protein
MEWQARGRQQQRVQGKWRRRLPPSADALFHGATFWKGAQMIVAYSLTIRAGLPIIAAGALGLVLLVRSRFLAKACVNVTNLTILCERVGYKSPDSTSGSGFVLGSTLCGSEFLKI